MYSGILSPSPRGRGNRPTFCSIVNQMSNGILVFIEHKGGELNKTSLEAVVAAQKLAGDTGQKAAAVVLGSGAQALAQEIAAYDLEKTILADHAHLADYTPDAYAA